MPTNKGFDHSEAMCDPRRVFGEPASVLSIRISTPGASERSSKAGGRTRCGYPSQEGENMGGGEEPMLKRVNDALLELERQTGESAAHTRTITS